LSFVANSLADVSDCVLDEIAHDEMLASFADIDGKVLQNFYTTRGMRDFRVKLNAYTSSQNILA
jgi:hypothetical protein